MKTKLMLLVSAAIVLILTSCGNKPETVVEEYYTYLSKGEFDKAKKYLVKEHQNWCDLLNAFTPEENKTDMAKADVKVKNIKCDIKDDTTAVCTCEIITKLKDKEETTKETVKLKKIKGKWYVNQGKEGLMGGDGDDDDDDIIAPTSNEDDLLSEIEKVTETEEI